MKALVAHHQPVSYAKISKPLSNISTCTLLQCKSSLLAYQSPEILGFKKFNIQCISIIKPISVKKKFGVVYASESEPFSAKNVAQGWLLQPVGDGDCKHIGFKVPLPGAYEIFSSEMVVGREPEKADLVIPVATVSGLHARIENKEGTLFVTDLDSTNGTYINEKRVAPGASEVVPPGSLLTFGDTNLAIFKVSRIKKSLEKDGEESEEDKGNEGTEVAAQQQETTS